MRTSIITLSTLLILVAGCGPPPQVVEFKAKVKNYVDESRAFAKLLETGPSLNQVISSADKLMDLYAHLPTAPVELKSGKEVSAHVDDLKHLVSRSPRLLRNRLDLSESTNDYGKLLFTKVDDQYKQRIVDIRQACDKIEEALAK